MSHRGPSYPVALAFRLGVVGKVVVGARGAPRQFVVDARLRAGETLRGMGRIDRLAIVRVGRALVARERLVRPSAAARQFVASLRGLSRQSLASRHRADLSTSGLASGDDLDVERGFDLGDPLAQISVSGRRDRGVTGLRASRDGGLSARTRNSSDGIVAGRPLDFAPARWPGWPLALAKTAPPAARVWPAAIFISKLLGVSGFCVVALIHDNRKRSLT